MAMIVQSRTGRDLLLGVLLAVALGGAPGTSSAQSAAATLQGAVTSAGPDGQPFNIPGASLRLSGPPLGGKPLTLFSDGIGAYKFQDLAAGSYTLEASFQGFKTAAKTVTLPAGANVVENLRLELAELRQE